MLSKTRQALRDGYRILLEWIPGKGEMKFFYLDSNKEIRLRTTNMSNGLFTEEGPFPEDNSNKHIKMILMAMDHDDEEFFSIGEHHGLWGAPATVTSSINKIHPLDNHCKCTKCGDEIFMAGADTPNFRCYTCRNQT